MSRSFLAIVVFLLCSTYSVHASLWTDLVNNTDILNTPSFYHDLAQSALVTSGNITLGGLVQTIKQDQPYWLFLDDNGATSSSSTCSSKLFVLQTDMRFLSGTVPKSPWIWQSLDISSFISLQSLKKMKVITSPQGALYAVIFGGRPCSGPLNLNTQRPIYSLRLSDYTWTILTQSNVPSSIGTFNVDSSIATGSNVFLRLETDQRIFVLSFRLISTGQVSWTTLTLTTTFAKAAYVCMYLDVNSQINIITSADVNQVLSVNVSSLTVFNAILPATLTVRSTYNHVANLPARTGDSDDLSTSTGLQVVYGGSSAITNSSNLEYGILRLINTNALQADIFNTGTSSIYRNMPQVIVRNNTLFAFGGQIFTDPTNPAGTTIANDNIAYLSLNLSSSQLISQALYVNETLNGVQSSATVTPLTLATSSTSLQGSAQQINTPPAILSSETSNIARTYTTTVQYFTTTNPSAPSIEPVDPTQQSSKIGTLITIGAVVGAVIVVLVTLSISCYCYRQRNPKLQARSVNNFDAAMAEIEASEMEAGGRTTAYGANQTTMFTQGKALALPGFLRLQENHDYSCGEQIAEGGGGVLYIGEILNGSQIQNNQLAGEKCVVKIIKDLEGADAQESFELFQQEVSIMWLLHTCKNIVTMHGYCDDPQTILMKFYGLGSLEDLIHKSGAKKDLVTDAQWTPKFVLRMLRDVVAGITFMHESGIVHNDLKPPNILLENDKDGSLYAAICDFGVSSVIDANLLRVKAYRKSRVKGTSLVYAAPEVLDSYERDDSIEEHTIPEIYKAGDVYAFAMTAYEMVTRKIPWWDVDDLDEIAQGVLNGKRPKVSSGLNNRRQSDDYLNLILTIMEKCSSQKPLDRPPLRSVLASISNMLQSSLQLKNNR